MKIATKNTCSICGGKYYAKGLCSVHYQRQKKGRDMSLGIRPKGNVYKNKGEYTEVTFFDRYRQQKGKFIISNEDVNKVAQYRWSEVNTGYIAAYFNKKMILLHRFLTDCPEGLVVDHVNHDRKDNRRENLKICTQKENCQNLPLNIKSNTGIRYITKTQNRYYKVNVKGKYVGCSTDLEKAKEKLYAFYHNKAEGVTYE